MTAVRFKGTIVLIFCLLNISLLPPATSVLTWKRKPETDKGQIQKREEDNFATFKVMSAAQHPSNMYKTTLKELSDYSVLQNDMKDPLFQEFTICSTIFTTRDGTHYPLVLLGNDGNIFVRTYIWNVDNGPFNTSQTGFSIENIEYHDRGLSLIPKVFPYQWVKSCVALSVSSGSVKLVVNGILVHDTTSYALMKAKERFPANLIRKVVIGAVRKSNGGWTSINHKVTDINVFSSALSVELMTNKTEANSESSDNEDVYLNWEDMEWEIHGDIHLETVVRENPNTMEPHMTMYPTQFIRMSDCMHHCQKLGGRAPKVVSDGQWQDLKSFMRMNFYYEGNNARNVLAGLWLSVSDREKEGEWKDFYTGEVMDYDGPFEGGYPNGGDKQNCVVQTSKDNWNDVDCYAKSWNNFCVCTHVNRPYLTLRGICVDSAIDSVYIPRNNMQGHLQYLSSMGSVISFNEKSNLWYIAKNDFETLDLSGYTASSKVSFCLGKHNWTIENDTNTCGQGKPYAAQLKLTHCVDGEFTCNNGQCVKTEDRCDQVVQCKDESDEKKLPVVGVEGRLQQKDSTIKSHQRFSCRSESKSVNYSFEDC